MSNCKHNNSTEETTACNVNVDVTRIVKYSCISSVLIVLIVFGSKMFKEWMNHN